MKIEEKKSSKKKKKKDSMKKWNTKKIKGGKGKNPPDPLMENEDSVRCIESEGVESTEKEAGRTEILSFFFESP